MKEPTITASSSMSIRVLRLKWGRNLMTCNVIDLWQVLDDFTGGLGIAAVVKRVDIITIS